MREHLDPPWIRFPDLTRDHHPPEEGIEQFVDWLKFLHTLSPDELVQYEQTHPAPPGWEVFYNLAANRHCLPKKMEAAMRSLTLIQKMWQTTTLK